MVHHHVDEMDRRCELITLIVGTCDDWGYPRESKLVIDAVGTRYHNIFVNQSATASLGSLDLRKRQQQDEISKGLLQIP